MKNLLAASILLLLFLTRAPLCIAGNPTIGERKFPLILPKLEAMAGVQVVQKPAGPPFGRDISAIEVQDKDGNLIFSAQYRKDKNGELFGNLKVTDAKKAGEIFAAAFKDSALKKKMATIKKVFVHAATSGHNFSIRPNPDYMGGASINKLNFLIFPESKAMLARKDLKRDLKDPDPFVWPAGKEVNARVYDLRIDSDRKPFWMITAHTPSIQTPDAVYSSDNISHGIALAIDPNDPVMQIDEFAKPMFIDEPDAEIKLFMEFAIKTVKALHPEAKSYTIKSDDGEYDPITASFPENCAVPINSGAVLKLKKAARALQKK